VEEAAVVVEEEAVAAHSPDQDTLPSILAVVVEGEVVAAEQEPGTDPESSPAHPP
jgi:hypothetical protein